MENQAKKFDQYIKESDGIWNRQVSHEAAVVFDPKRGSIVDIMFGNFSHDYHGLEDAAGEGYEAYLIEYDPEDGGIYVYDGQLNLDGVKVIKKFH